MAGFLEKTLISEKEKVQRLVMVIDDTTYFGMDKFGMGLAKQVLSMKGLMESGKLMHRCSISRFKSAAPKAKILRLSRHILPQTDHSRIMKMNLPCFL